MTLRVPFRPGTHGGRKGLSDRFKTVSVSPALPVPAGGKSPPPGEAGGAADVDMIPPGKAPVLGEVGMDGRERLIGAKTFWRWRRPNPEPGNLGQPRQDSLGFTSAFAAAAPRAWDGPMIIAGQGDGRQRTPFP